MALLALFTMLGSPVMADATHRDRSIQQDTGKNGAKLKWLPYRPSVRSVNHLEQKQEARQVELTSYQTSDSAETEPSAQEAQPSQPVNEQNWQLPGLDSQPVLSPSPDREETAVPSQIETTPIETTPSQVEAPSVNPEMPGPPRDLPENIRREIEKGKIEPRYQDYQVPTVKEERTEGLFQHYDDCPSEHDFKPIDELTDKVVIADGDYPKECKLPGKYYEPRQWESTLFTWKASGLCHNPLYFEEMQLERYGHSWGPYLQPVISQGHFFVTIPLLPYKMGLNPPRECEYSLGYYRPGNCAPYMIDPFPLSIRAGLVQTAAVLGGVYLLP